MNLQTKPVEVAKKQALAAIGQVHLMRYYEDFFSALNMVCCCFA
jgi:glutamate 5-kinase